MQARLIGLLAMLLISSFSFAQTKPVLVVLPIEVKQQDQEYASDFGSALQQGLSERYRVYYGPAVEKELQKEYEKLDCTAEQCRQNVAIAFNGELIGQASAKRLGSGYVLKFEVHNVFTGEIVESNTQPCRDCDGFAVIDGLKALGRNQANTAQNPVVINTGQSQANNSQPTDVPAIVIFDSNPSGAKVTINGKDAGVTPYQGLQHTLGEVLNVQLSKAFYQPLGFDISVNKELIRLNQPMQLQAGQGRATFALEPYRQGASLWLNGQQYGELPQVLQLAAGQYTAEAKAGSKLLASQAITVQHNSQQTVQLQDETLYKTGQSFKDCSHCPEMVVVPAGSFQMGSNTGDEDEQPVHKVTIAKPFAVGKYEVTKAQFAVFANATGYQTDAEKNTGNAQGCYTNRDGRDKEWDWTAGVNWRNADFKTQPQGNSNHPVVCISYNDAQAYIDWLNQQTGKAYRLLSEAEWEYAARAGTTTNTSYGNASQCGYANGTDTTKLPNGNSWNNKAECTDGYAFTAPVGSFKANPWGLYDMHGNVWEWVQDCWNASYNGAPANGSAWMDGNCGRAVVRGGSFNYKPADLRSAGRGWNGRASREAISGFRLAQDL